jgi:hypothetical protein
LHGAFVPHVDAAKRINSKYGGFGSIDTASILMLLGKTTGDILPDANYTNYVALRITSRGGIE